MKISYRDTEIYFSSEGTGNPLILLHGFMESSKIWNDFVPSLAVNRQVVCIDLPGHGESGCFNEIHSMEDMAKAVKEVLWNLNIEKAAVAGHSMGGYVSLELSKIFPTLLRSLTLINSTPEADSEERKINRDRAVSLVNKNKSAFVKMAISNLMLPDSSKKHNSEVQNLVSEALKMSGKAITAATKGMKIRSDNFELFAKMEIPKNIIAGKQDPILDLDGLKLLANKGKSNLHVLEGGHLSFIEDKQVLRKLLHLID
ncbi:alpha/beta fold hydrolase [Autumnicola psychrophila]|uniref:Alpha/beta hydrolase n=1 Tax=Autumnicola psychrophila TaxID=3075592 RepID=A0ABU3DNT3_9FLAO|nr:alpha/beta hydrolase [Zunongwangia sp. F225]MDT0685356.1 alpha/beta hydrolase [Zunongwangia sp. F225]